jgi:putative Holliday junction resolvase
LSDPTRFLASALEVLEESDVGRVCTHIAALCEERDVAAVVVGLPLNMDGSRGPRSEQTEAFVQALRKRVDVPVSTWDERLSTRSAHDALREAGLDGRQRKGVVDKVAAQIILQGFLDAQQQSPPQVDGMDGAHDD